MGIANELAVDIAQSIKNSNKIKYRIAYLVTHPIQYQAPMLRFIASQPDIYLKVFFQSDMSIKGHFDRQFGRAIQWDVPLLDGYDHEFLPSVGRRDRLSRIRPLSFGIARRLWQGNFDALWVHGYSRWFNWIAMLAARSMGIATLLRDDATLLSQPRSAVKVRMKRAIFFPALRTICDGFLATGTRNREYYLYNGICAERIFLVPNCVDNDYFARTAQSASARREVFRAELGLSAGRPVILFAAKFLPLKRAGDLLAAFERVLARWQGPDPPYLLLVGEGETRSQLEAQAVTLGDNVRFLGFRNQSELPGFYDLCNVFVLSSQFETWGLAINEVMNAGRPVIASDRVGCWPDLVHDGVNGCVYPCGDVAALADALDRILRAPDGGEAMGKASLDIVGRWSFKEDLQGLRSAMDAVTWAGKSENGRQRTI
jgi:glycosyltransferase involved in cell wall biosynthesis